MKKSLGQEGSIRPRIEISYANRLKPRAAFARQVPETFGLIGIFCYKWAKGGRKESDQICEKGEQMSKESEKWTINVNGRKESDQTGEIGWQIDIESEQMNIESEQMNLSE